MSHPAVLWTENRPCEIEDLIQLYRPLVAREVRRLCRTLPARFDRSELEAYCLVGLYEAIQRFDPSRNVPFEHFARRRIRGAVLDGVRTEMWAPSLTTECREMEEVRLALVSRLGREPSEAELAEELGVKPERLTYLQAMTSICHPISLDMELPGEDGAASEAVHNAVPDPQSPEPLGQVIRQERLEVLTQQIDQLPERERLIITLVFYEELSQREVAQLLNISGPRVSQLLSAGLRRLRRALTDYVQEA